MTTKTDSMENRMALMRQMAISGPILNCMNSMATRPPMVVRELELISGMLLASDLDDRLFQGQGLVFLLEVVAEDDGVVQRKGQLQNVRDRVGNERDGAQQEVGAHVEDHAHHER